MHWDPPVTELCAADEKRHKTPPNTISMVRDNVGGAQQWHRRIGLGFW